MTPRHCSCNEWSRRTLVGVEIVFLQRTVVGLVLHVFAAARKQKQGCSQQNERRDPAGPLLGM
jgi:hypothetical protein